MITVISRLAYVHLLHKSQAGSPNWFGWLFMIWATLIQLLALVALSDAFSTLEFKISREITVCRPLLVN